MATSGINLIQLGLDLHASKHAKGSDINDILIENQLAAAYLALVQAYSNAQAKAAQEDAQQTDEQIAKGEATAQVVASFNQSQSGHSAHANSAAAQVSNGALGVGAVGAK